MKRYFIIILILSSIASLSFAIEDFHNKKFIHEISISENNREVNDVIKEKSQEDEIDNVKPTLLPVYIDRNIVIRKVTISKFEQIQTLRDFGIEVPAILENVKIDEFEPQTIPLKLTNEQIDLINKSGIQTEKMPKWPKPQYRLLNRDADRGTYTVQGDDGYDYEGDYNFDSEFYESAVVLGDNFLTIGIAYYLLYVPAGSGISIYSLYVGCRGRSNDNQVDEGGVDLSLWNWNTYEFDYICWIPGSEPTGWWACDLSDYVDTYVDTNGCIYTMFFYDFDTVIDDDDYHIDWVRAEWDAYTAPDFFDVWPVNTIPPNEPYTQWDFEVDIDALCINGIANNVYIEISDDKGNEWGPFGPYDFVEYETDDNRIFGTWYSTWYSSSPVTFTFHAYNSLGSDDFVVLPPIEVDLSHLVPDIRIIDIWYEDVEQIVQNEPFDFHVLFDNIGDGVANDIDIFYEGHHNGSWIEIGTDSHSSLDPGEDREEHEVCEWVYSCGYVEFRVRIPAVEGETNTSNNIREETWYVQPDGAVDESLPLANSELLTNYPNPFNPSTTIKYGLEKPDYVELKIYNTQGQLVETLVDENKPAGYHTIEWNVPQKSGMSSGIYFYKLKTDNVSITKKMLFVR